MTITKQRLNEILKEEINRELQERRVLEEQVRVDDEMYEAILKMLFDGGSKKSQYMLYNKRYNLALDPWKEIVDASDEIPRLKPFSIRRAVTPAFVAGVYGGLKMTDAEQARPEDFDLAALVKDARVVKKNYSAISKNPQQFLGALGRFGAKLGMNKAKLNEIARFASYMQLILPVSLFGDEDEADTYVRDEIIPQLKQNYADKQEKDKSQSREVDRIAKRILGWMKTDGKSFGNRAVAAAKKYDNRMLDQIAKEVIRRVGKELDPNKDEEFFNAVMAQISNPSVILAALQ